MQREVLKRPLLSEKLMTSGEYAFEVDIKANKPEIIKIIKEIFKVDPIAIRTMIVKGRSKKTFKTRANIVSSSWKKAIVRLAKDQKIDIFETKNDKS